LLSYIDLISFTFHNVLSIIIHNECSDFELVSPSYLSRGVTWYIPPDQEVDANTSTRISFAKEITKNEFTSALIYRLQRKNIESNADNTSIQLLIIWKFDKMDEFSARVLLIKYSNTITWDDNMLKKLHAMDLTPLDDYADVSETWLLDDATMLTTTLMWDDEWPTLEITIETGNDDSMDSPCVPLSI
jgi:hypothetical protein